MTDGVTTPPYRSGFRPARVALVKTGDRVSIAMTIDSTFGKTYVAAVREFTDRGDGEGDHPSSSTSTIQRSVRMILSCSPSR